MYEVCLYNDLHNENIAFDYKLKKINWIFDFSDILIWDINMDFLSFYYFDTEFMEQIVYKYQELSWIKLNLRHIVIFARIEEISDLAEFIDKKDSEIYKEAILKINKWLKEIDIFNKS
jgi:hypothetical protein